MFSRPTLTQLRGQAVNDILVETGLPALLPRSPLLAMAYAQAGAAQGVYGYLDWIAQQSNPFTSTGSILEAWGALVSITRLPASAATGSATFTGTGFIAAGSALRRQDGAQYTTTADLTLSGPGTVAIVATTAGAAGTLATGSTVSLVSPVGGVISVAIATDGAAGADQENDQALRTRILERWSAPPQGGSVSDYLAWTLAVPGVTRAWINPLGAGSGTVVIYTMFDQAEAANGGFPQGSNGGASAESRIAPATGDQLTVANALFPLRPATALVYSVAPIAQPVNFTIKATGQVTSAVQALVQMAIDKAFIAASTPLTAELPLSPFEAAIAGVSGMPSFTLLAPSGLIAAPLGYLPVRGLISYA